MIKILAALLALSISAGAAWADVAQSPFLCSLTSHEAFDVNYESVSNGDNKSGGTLIYADEEKAIICTKGAGCTPMKASGGHYFNKAMDTRYYGPLAFPTEEEADLGNAETGDNSIQYTGTCKAVKAMDLKEVRRALKK